MWVTPVNQAAGGRKETKVQMESPEPTAKMDVQELWDFPDHRGPPELQVHQVSPESRALLARTVKWADQGTTALLVKLVTLARRDLAENLAHPDPRALWDLPDLKASEARAVSLGHRERLDHQEVKDPRDPEEPLDATDLTDIRENPEIWDLRDPKVVLESLELLDPQVTPERQASKVVLGTRGHQAKWDFPDHQVTQDCKATKVQAVRLDSLETEALGARLDRQDNPDLKDQQVQLAQPAPWDQTAERVTLETPETKVTLAGPDCLALRVQRDQSVMPAREAHPARQEQGEMTGLAELWAWREKLARRDQLDRWDPADLPGKMAAEEDRESKASPDHLVPQVSQSTLLPCDPGLAG